MEYENAKTYLKVADKEGRSLYDHLTDVLANIIKEKPENPLARLEQISAQLKQDGFQQRQLKEAPSAPLSESDKEKLQQSVKRTVSLLKPERKEDEEEPEVGHVPDVQGDARLLQAAGVGVSAEDSYKLLLAVYELASTKPLESVRVFGKILGIQKDYWIVEAKLKEYPEKASEDPYDKTEAPGAGVNEYVYFVTNSLGGSWAQLPDVTPEQIKIARQVRRYFSGDLDNEIKGYPHFPWSEASLLRAQIARIAASTVISPKGFYTLDAEAEEPTIVEDAEYKGSPASELVAAEGWVHHRRQLLQQGRQRKWRAPEQEEQDEDGNAPKRPEEPENEAAEEEAELLRGLESDEKAWAFRVEPRGPAFPHAIAWAESLLWPGAVTAAQGTRFTSIYVGYGQKWLGARYVPPALPEIQGEWSLKKGEDEEEQQADPLQEQTDPLPPPPEPAAEEKPEDGAEGDAAEEDEEQ